MTTPTDVVSDPLQESYDQRDISEAHRSLSDTYTRGIRNGVLMLDGHGLTMSVHSGSLTVESGVGPYRRTLTFSRATHGLTRVVIMGYSGTVTLDALRWCDRLDIPVLMLDTDQRSPMFIAYRALSDARLRRAQASLPDRSLGLDIARYLLAAKIDGQRAILADRFHDRAGADILATLREGLALAPDIRSLTLLEASAAARYWQAWSGSSVTCLRFTKSDADRVPQHWTRFDGRRSVLMSGNTQKKADRPLNAILNYTFALAEAEAVRACLALGLDPSLGIVHQDRPGRPSMALDVMEPVRPNVETWVLSLLHRHTFTKRDFHEAPDGAVRLMQPLTHELAESLPLWARAVAPWAETAAHMIGGDMPGRYNPTAPLSGRRRQLAAQSVKARRDLGGPQETKSLGVESPREARSRKVDDITTEQAPETDNLRAAPVHSVGAGRSPDCKSVSWESVEAASRSVLDGMRDEDRRERQRSSELVPFPTATCGECGTPLTGHLRRYCPSCGVLQPGMGPEDRAHRGPAIAAARAEHEAWKASHGPARIDAEHWRSDVLPLLAGVRLSDIMRACGVAKSTASLIRSGKHVPAARHYPALVTLAQESRC